MEVVHSEYVSPCSPRVLKRWGHDVRQDMEGRHEEAFRRERVDLEGVREMEAKAVAKRASLDMGVGTLPELTYSLNGRGSSDDSSGFRREVEEVRDGAKRSKFKGLFEGFPQTLIVVGDAERLVREVKSLEVAMEKDGVTVQAEWVRDTVHDVLMMNQWWWDWGVVEGLWRVVGDWAARLEE
jgi:acetyl esterase/lipase